MRPPQVWRDFMALGWQRGGIIFDAAQRPHAVNYGVYCSELRRRPERCAGVLDRIRSGPADASALVAEYLEIAGIPSTS